jgi:hypothetical protein
MMLTGGQWGRVGSACLAATVVLVTACSKPMPDAPESSRPVGPPPSKSVGASALNGGELHALTAAGVIDAITKAGLPAPNPLDTTAQDCPRIGCTQSIVTDTVAVKSFDTTGQAARFAVPRGLFQVATVVVSFAPVLTEAERARYRAQLPMLVD